MSKTCPVCGAIAEYNAYYGRVTCTSCGWVSEHITANDERKPIHVATNHIMRFPIVMIRFTEKDDVRDTNGTIFGREKDGSTISYAKQGLSTCNTISVIDPNGYASRRSDSFFRSYVSQAVKRGESIVLAGDADQSLEQYIRSHLADTVAKGGYRVEVFDVLDHQSMSFDMNESLKRSSNVTQVYDRAERYAATFMEHTTYDAPLTYDMFFLAKQIMRLRFMRPQFYGSMALPDMTAHSYALYNNPNPGTSLYASPNGVPDRLNTEHWQLISCNSQKTLNDASRFGETLLFKDLEKLGEKARTSGNDIGILAHDMFSTPTILILRWNEDFRCNGLAAVILSAVIDILASNWPFKGDTDKLKPVNVIIRDLASVGYIDRLGDIAVKAKSRGINTVIGMKELDALENKRIDTDKLIASSDTKMLYLLSRKTVGRNAHPFANASYWRYLSNTFTDQVYFSDENNILLFPPRCKNPIVLTQPPDC